MSSCDIDSKLLYWVYDSIWGKFYSRCRSSGHIRQIINRTRAGFKEIWKFSPIPIHRFVFVTPNNLLRKVNTRLGVIIQTVDLIGFTLNVPKLKHAPEAKRTDIAKNAKWRRKAIHISILYMLMYIQYIQWLTNINMQEYLIIWIRASYIYIYSVIEDFFFFLCRSLNIICWSISPSILS